jgi:hypothetical protein
MANIRFIFILITLLLSLNSFSQKVSNVRVSQEGNSVVVVYDLSGKYVTFDVNLFYTVDDGKTWRGPLKNVTGDVINQNPGLNKKAVWNAASEAGNIEGMVQFKLEALATSTFSVNYQKYKKSKNIWLAFAITSAAAGTYSYLQSEKYYDQYQTSTTDAADLHQKVKLYDQITPVAFGVAGFCALEFVIKAGKQSKAKKQSLSFYPQPVTRGGGIGLAYTF